MTTASTSRHLLPARTVMQDFIDYADGPWGIPESQMRIAKPRAGERSVTVRLWHKGDTPPYTTHNLQAYDARRLLNWLTEVIAEIDKEQQ